jgi:hypothetical protein
MTEPIPVQVALNSNAFGGATGSADTLPATISETAPAAAIVAMKRLIRHLPSGCRRSVKYPTAGVPLQGARKIVNPACDYWRYEMEREGAFKAQRERQFV